jgi:excisionase family DNA binding protein
MEAATTANWERNLVRLKVAAARLGVSVRTVYRIIAEGGLALVRIRGCSCLKEADLTAYVEKSKQRTNDD